MEQKAVNKIYKNKRILGQEMCLTAQISEFEIDQLIMDLGFDANFIPKQTWQKMGELKLEGLQYSCAWKISRTLSQWVYFLGS